MNSKERVLTAISHKEADKIPVDSWLAPEICQEISSLFNLDDKKDPFIIKKFLGDDILYKHMGSSRSWSTIYMPEKKIGENLYQDDFGIKWKKKLTPHGGSYCEFVEHPLADMKAYSSFKMPDPLATEKDDLDLYRKLVKKHGSSYAIAGSAANSVLECSWYLRGLEAFLMDLYINKDFASDLMDKVMNYHLELAKELTKIGVDIILYGDDIACERGPLVSPKIYRKEIKPRHAHLIEEVRKINRDVKIAYHSCGNVEWALNDLIEIGVDILNPLQPDVNDVAAVKKKYGDKLTFWGNVDTRNIMTNGSAKDVINEVKNVIDVLGPGGGLILASNHTVQYSKKALDNTINFYWAAEKLRDYPIK